MIILGKILPFCEKKFKMEYFVINSLFFYFPKNHHNFLEYERVFKIL
jgi:hypothetical protein